MKIRIQASEQLRYSKVTEVDDETIAMFIQSAESKDSTISANDFLLESGDVNDWEFDLDDLQLDKFVDGKWQPIWPPDEPSAKV